MKKITELFKQSFTERNNEVFNERNRLMWANAWMSQPKHYNLVYGIISVFSLVILFCVIYLIEDLPNIISFGTRSEIPVTHNPLILAIKHPIIFVGGICVIAAGYFIFLYKINVSYAPLNVGQKGTQRWTTREEIEKQFKAIPEKKERFPGGGGVPIARSEDKIFIDDSAVNNLIIGITRSGKGELVVFPEIDIYSRAEKQASLIMTDPKLELAATSIPILQKRGYECHVLNLIDPDYSMGYNPLTCCLEEYKKGNEDDAKLLCGAFCFSIFNPDQATGDNKFFEDNSTTLLTALILAAIEDNVEADKKLNEKRRFKHERAEEKRRNEALSKLNYDQQRRYLIQKNIREMKAINPEIHEETIAKELNLEIAEVCECINSEQIEIDYIPKKFKEIFPNEKNVNMFSIINTFSVLASKKISQNETMLDKYFSERPEGNTARLLYSSTGIAGEKTKGSIYSNMLTALKVFNYENIARMTAESTLDMTKIGFGTKPVAIFIGMPDYDKSNYFLATAFIRQLYFTLAKMAEHAPGGQCSREVVFILDEFGNIPPIENLATIITICLGRKIRFNLIIQAFAQVHKLYGEDAKTIIGNCGNQIYIQTSDGDTAEEFSGNLGSETITSVNRTGKIFSLNKERTEMAEEQRLLSKNELMRLQPGETVVNRVMKRQDLNRKGVIPFPICNMNKYKMKHRFEYLLDDFPSGNILYSSPLTKQVFDLLREQQMKEIDELKSRGIESNIELIGKPNPIDVDLETTLHINLNDCLWSAENYIRQRTMPLNEYLTVKELHVLYECVSFNDETIKAIDEGLIKTYQVFDSIERLINSSDPELRENGYRADDLFDLDGDKSIITELDEVWESIKEQIIFDDVPEYFPTAEGRNTLSSVNYMHEHRATEEDMQRIQAHKKRMIELQKQKKEEALRQRIAERNKLRNR